MFSNFPAAYLPAKKLPTLGYARLLIWNVEVAMTNYLALSDPVCRPEPEGFGRLVFCIPRHTGCDTGGSLPLSRRGRGISMGTRLQYSAYSG
jgi:hypothetical protein